MSHQHVLDSLFERAMTLNQATQTHVTTQLTDLKKQYAELCQISKNLLARCEENVAIHQNYNDSYQSCEQTVRVLREKLATCSDTTGDRFALQNKLELLHDLSAQLMVCEQNVKQMTEISNKTMATSSAAGKEKIKREMSQVQDDLSNLLSEVDDAKNSLQKVLQLWRDFEDSHEALNHWLHRTELQLKEVELKATLEEKQQQVVRLKVSLLVSKSDCA